MTPARPPRRLRQRLTPGQLDTQDKGELTIATDKPAYPPYFIDNDPTNGKGFESAVAYAVADELGYDKAKVKWTVEPFNSSYAPGPKDFDFDVNQISITPRAKGRRLLDAVLHGQPGGRRPRRTPTRPSDIARRAQGAKLGVQIGTTSLDGGRRGDRAGRGPAGLQQLRRRGHGAQERPGDAVVVDVPTALYVTAAQVQDADVVGQFRGARRRPVGRAARQGLPAHRLRLAGDRGGWKASGELDALNQRWMSKAAGAPLRAEPRYLKTLPGAVSRRRPRPRSQSAPDCPPPRASAIVASNGRRLGAQGATSAGEWPASPP